MKSIIAPVVLFLIPFLSNAEILLVSEILIEQSQHDLHSMQSTESLFERESISQTEKSFGFRLGVKFIDNLTLELGKHEHGNFINEVTVYLPKIIDTPGSIPFYSDGYDVYSQTANLKSSSIRYGIKGEFELISRVSINARLGMARWQDNQEDTINYFMVEDNKQAGNDLYYAFGANYNFTKEFNIGIEYSLVTINDRTYINEELVALYAHDIEDLSLIIGWEF